MKYVLVLLTGLSCYTAQAQVSTNYQSSTYSPTGLEYIYRGSFNRFDYESYRSMGSYIALDRHSKSTKMYYSSANWKGVQPDRTFVYVPQSDIDNLLSGFVLDRGADIEVRFGCPNTSYNRAMFPMMSGNYYSGINQSFYSCRIKSIDGYAINGVHKFYTKPKPVKGFSRARPVPK